MKRLLMCVFILFSSCSSVNERAKIESFGIKLPEHYLIIKSENKDAIGDSYEEIEIKIYDKDFEAFFNSLPIQKMILSPQGDYFLFRNKKNINNYLSFNRRKKTITLINIDE